MFSSFKRFLPLIVILLLVLAVAGVYFFRLPPFSQKWQAVFLTNGQVYFGHMRPSVGNYVKLTNIYYLQVTQQLQPAGQTVPDIRLVKLGGELHGPEDAMYIMREQILFWENLKEDSRVVQGIKQLQTQQ
jgi:hypothetical protein